MLCEICPSIKDLPERVISKGIIFVIISTHMCTCICMYSYQPFPHTVSVLHNCSATCTFKALYPEISLSSLLVFITICFHFVILRLFLWLRVGTFWRTYETLLNHVPCCCPLGVQPLAITKSFLWAHWGWIHFNFQLQWMRVSISQKSHQQNVLFESTPPPNA